jgi:hypothetical protein
MQRKGRKKSVEEKLSKFFCCAPFDGVSAIQVFSKVSLVASGKSAESWIRDATQIVIQADCNSSVWQ